MGICRYNYRAENVWFNAIDRTDLLDKYNCLALPGTSEDEKHSDNKVRSKVRYMYYHSISEHSILDISRSCENMYLHMYR